jgi:hypothetical protein
MSGAATRLQEMERNNNAAMWTAAACLFAFSICVVLDRHFIGHTSTLFWDLPVYLGAVDLLAAGENPYRSELLHALGVPSYFYFISPPAVMSLFAAIANTPLRYLFEPALMALHFAAMMGTPILLGRLFFGRSPARLALAAGAFFTLFATAGIGAFGAMNNGSILHFAIVAASLRGFAGKRWTAFHIAVTAAAMFKPYYASFWLLPVLAHGFSWRQTMTAAGCAALAAAAYLLPALLAPELFQSWAANIFRSLSVGDVGENIYGLILKWGAAAPSWTPYAGQLAFMALLGLLLLVTRLRGPKLWAALFISAIFMNPRPMGYDVAPAAVPLAYLCATFLPWRVPLGWRLLASTYALAGAMLMLSYNDWLIPAPLLFPVIVAATLITATMQAGIALPWNGWRRPLRAEAAMP